MGLDIYFEKRNRIDENAEKREKLQKEYDSIGDELESRGEDYHKVWRNQQNIEFSIDRKNRYTEELEKSKDDAEKDVKYLTDGIEREEKLAKEYESEIAETDPVGTIRAKIAEDKPLFDRMCELGDELDELDPHEEIAYFRKVNFLVEFFDYEENCSYKYISKEDIEELISRCTQILDKKAEWDNTHPAKKEGEEPTEEELEEVDEVAELAEELLPTTSGCFFGSMEYDEWYYQDVENVKTEFTRILGEIDWENEIVEMYCWW